MGSVGVVFGAPVLGEDLSFEQTTEGFGGQEFVAKASVEGFTVPVLPRCAGFDEHGAHRAEAGPVGECVTGQFGAVSIRMCSGLRPVVTISSSRRPVV